MSRRLPRPERTPVADRPAPPPPALMVAVLMLVSTAVFVAGSYVYLHLVDAAGPTEVEWGVKRWKPFSVPAPADTSSSTSRLSDTLFAGVILTFLAYRAHRGRYWAAALGTGFAVLQVLSVPAQIRLLLGDDQPLFVLALFRLAGAALELTWIVVLIWWIRERRPGRDGPRRPAGGDEEARFPGPAR